MNIPGCHPKIAIYVVKQLKMIAFVRDCTSQNQIAVINDGSKANGEYLDSKA